MKPDDRRDELLEHLMEVGSASLEDLAARFNVSKMTIHRDLDDLERDGLLRKVRGGATIEASGQFESDFRYRARVGVSEKAAIAARAAEFVEPGTSVLVDDGSTTQHLVPFLIEKRPLTVITNSQSVIEGLTGALGIELIALGGSYSRKFNGFFGMLTLAALKNLRADVALLSSSAVQGRTAYHQDQDVLEVKRRMIASASRRYLLVDHQKFGRTALHMMSDLDVFDGVVTSGDLDPRQATLLRDNGIKTIIAEEGSA
ncbi:DeoR/GlpR family DNA-binding transcription regulator [Pelagovum pacificum]|uniref:DeoR/GlpR transcriptional regulator n=1 Tax=Pelagovum pacificum TaxID=2588711 RepID=A0A5C5GCQ2_9RHOB|nr:DeoR/GlpR family DNA-binding transcription regulator [Pelagovum pacificum]QQA41430.1 DeoR/GlpR transcriptional regulator [Pelagovum pacificum]TNY31767.1 DeoR/GlpR transcriptional regulator [Pelagovum pacificum]